MSRLACLTFFLATTLHTTSVSAREATPPHFKVAFIGDTGNGSGFENVLSLIAREGTDLVVHSGDFDYDDDPGSSMA